MKWFKHYSNATKSNALSFLMANYGVIGYGRYWLLLELMSEKFDGEKDTEFVFSTRKLKDHLGFHRDQDLFKFLSSLNQVQIMSHRTVNQATVISSSILLELQGRDFKKARSVRAETAPKNKIKNKIKNKNIYSDAQIAIYSFVRDLYLENFPGTTEGQKAKQRFFDQVSDDASRDDMVRSITNYKKRLDYDNRERVWRSPKTTFETYLGTEKSGYFWRDFINYSPPEIIGPDLSNIPWEKTGGDT